MNVRTALENMMPPLKNALPKKRIPVPTNDFSSCPTRQTYRPIHNTMGAGADLP